ncbi:hypothetical protein BD408DRAFT_415058 [Parasitella parasitica]|nr:hypothetical protein BD408DRAFT_415058 [Parasitella parasitica]
MLIGVKYNLVDFSLLVNSVVVDGFAQQSRTEKTSEKALVLGAANIANSLNDLLVTRKAVVFVVAVVFMVMAFIFAGSCRDQGSNRENGEDREELHFVCIIRFVD